MSSQRIAVIGGGPIGVEAALLAARRGHDVRLFEQGEIGAQMLQWGHVRLFTPWDMNQSPWGRQVAHELGIDMGTVGSCPTAAEFVTEYLQPLARNVLTEDRLMEHTSVRAIGRRDALKGDWIGDERRGRGPFRLIVEHDGQMRHEEVDCVIDASGVSTPRPMGRGGLPALGARLFEDRIERWIPDVLGVDRARYAGQDVLVVGSGYSAATTMRSLLQRNEGSAQSGTLYWSTAPGREPILIEDDPLASRRELTQFARDLLTHQVRPKSVEIFRSSWVSALAEADGRIAVTLETENGPADVVVDRIVSNVGYRPDLEMTRELQVHHCYASDGPMKLAAYLLSQTGAAGDCLAQTSGGADVLRTPEPDFFVLGSRSYGRNADFVLRLGHDQIDDLFSGWKRH